jgi:hypothetical protein
MATMAISVFLRYLNLMCLLLVRGVCCDPAIIGTTGRVLLSVVWSSLLPVAAVVVTFPPVPRVGVALFVVAVTVVGAVLVVTITVAL